ncbi:MAG: hypothetical protein IJQ53_00540 [Clostridia bacterium]|nr:hypothetical protein [Clostridia bacterium]
MIKRIPDAARQGIVDKLVLLGDVCGSIGSYRAFFERVYPECKTIEFNKTTLAAEIGRHCDVFKGDWGDESGMFSVVKILDWSDDQFLFFCQEYVNPVFNRYEWDEENEERVNLQPKCVEAINLYLSDCGYELRECGKIGDKKEYRLFETYGVHGSIQGIVFAAVGKPDVVFTDFLNQNIRIPRNNKKYLVYDQTIENEGLKWKALKDWYNTNRSESDPEFITRLKDSVDHCGSPIEKSFFSIYLDIVEEYGESVPALLPQVYLHYDTKTQRERTERIFEHQCMDFLIILSESRRIVIELDGVQHYAEDEEIKISDRPFPVHIASTSRYASMVAEQREMTLSGYEVYRFGGKEFQNDNIAIVVKTFFSDLFKKHGLAIE